MGLIGLSAWYEFVGRSGESRFNRGDVILRLSRSLNWSLPANIHSAILHALLIESSHWAPDISNQHRAELFLQLVKLIPTAPYELRSRLACALAGLTLGLNRGTTRLRTPQIPDQVDLEEGVSYDLARLLTGYYTKSANHMARDEQPLLLLALTGLMEHYENCDFDDKSRESTKLVAEQLSTLDILDKPQPVTLPKETLLHFDLREYFVEVLAHWLRRAHTSSTIDETVVHLLKAVKKKRYFWVGHGSLLALPILQILARTENPELQNLCLSASIHHLEFGPSVSYIHMLFTFDIPYKLVQSIKNPTQPGLVLRASATLAFQLIAERIEDSEPSQQSTRTSIENASSALLQRILRDDLLETFVRCILNSKTVSMERKFWETITLKSLQTSNSTLSEIRLYGTYQYLNRLIMRRASGMSAPMAEASFLTQLFRAIKDDIRSGS